MCYTAGKIELYGRGTIMNSELVAFRLPTTELLYLDYLASARGISRSAMLRELLKERKGREAA
jgi:hypothetical protein